MTKSFQDVRAMIVFFWIASVTSYAQDVPMPSSVVETAERAVVEMPAWTATVGGGLALTSGNTDLLSCKLGIASDR